jgi:hypothetical protein
MHSSISTKDRRGSWAGLITFVIDWNCFKLGMHLWQSELCVGAIARIGS